MSTYTNVDDLKSQWRKGVEIDPNKLWLLQENTPVPDEIRFIHDQGKPSHVLISPREDDKYFPRQFIEVTIIARYLSRYDKVRFYFMTKI